MRRLSAIILLFLLIFPSVGISEKLPPLPEGPLLLTSVTPEQLDADYWIDRLPNPDKLIKTDQEVVEFNQEIVDMFPDRVDVFSLPSREAGKYIKDQLQIEYKALSNRKLFDEADKVVPKSFFEKNVKPVVDIDEVPKRIQVRWGAAVQSTSVRALPTDKRMFEDVGDIEFDQLQFTRIKFWTPVAVMHESGDGEWYYVKSPYSRGWVRSRDIAIFESKEKLASYANRKNNFLIVTAPSIPLFSDIALEKIYRYPSMGTVLPITGETDRYWETYMPVRKGANQSQLWKAYVSKKSDVTVGRMAYTQRNVIKQAFKLLGARYGWGGTYKGRDCSGFVHDVFMSLGVWIPRNSKQQGYVGTQLGHFETFEDHEERIQALNHAMEGITLLRMPLHIMIYIGQIDGLHFVIHSTWAERISMTDDTKNRINQVVVSDLTLNGESRIGSLFQRIISINEVN